MSDPINIALTAQRTVSGSNVIIWAHIAVPGVTHFATHVFCEPGWCPTIVAERFRDVARTAALASGRAADAVTWAGTARPDFCCVTDVRNLVDAAKGKGSSDA